MPESVRRTNRSTHILHVRTQRPRDGQDALLDGGGRLVEVVVEAPDEGGRMERRRRRRRRSILLLPLSHGVGHGNPHRQAHGLAVPVHTEAGEPDERPALPVAVYRLGILTHASLRAVARLFAAAPALIHPRAAHVKAARADVAAVGVRHDGGVRPVGQHGGAGLQGVGRLDEAACHGALAEGAGRWIRDGRQRRWWRRRNGRGRRLVLRHGWLCVGGLGISRIGA